ncbi:MAG: O-antigen ligase family protein [Candidatus Cloacimonadaceae bacterium]|nr:O-antigen ligase family protein [Candidatus Cloacimonadaceae bacterium]
MTLNRISNYVLYGLLASLSLLLAIPMQMVEFTQIGIVLFILVAWLVVSLVYGLSLRNSLLFSALFFIKPIPMSFYGVLIISSFSLLGEYLQSGKRTLNIPYPFAMLILGCTSLYGLMRARDIGDASIYFLATAVAPFLLLVIFANSRLKESDFVEWIKAVVLVSAFLGIIGVAMGILNPQERYGSLWITAMTINGFYTLSFFFAIALSTIEPSVKLKYLWHLCALLIFLGMLYTYTRIALLAVFFGFFLLMLRLGRFRYIGFGMLFVIPLIIPASMMSRIQMGFDFDISIFIRFLAWYHAIDQIVLHPFFGIGIGVWKEWFMGVVPFDFLYAEHPHNLYLKILLEIGLFGFLAYFYIIGATLRRHYRNCVKKSGSIFDYIIMTGVLALLFSCMTDIFIQQYSISLVFWTTLGFLYLRSRVNQANPIEDK